MTDFDNFTLKLFEVSGAGLVSTFSRCIVISTRPKPGVLTFLYSIISHILIHLLDRK